MTINELKALISGIEGAANARANKTNFIVVPCEDGVAKINVSVAMEKATKAHNAFNVEAAIAEYKAYEAEKALKEAEKANKPKVVKGPNPEAQARRDELDALITALPSFTDYTATDILNALGNNVSEKVTRMAVGQSAQRLVTTGVLTMDARKPEGKTSVQKFYTKA